MSGFSIRAALNLTGAILRKGCIPLGLATLFLQLLPNLMFQGLIIPSLTYRAIFSQMAIEHGQLSLLAFVVIFAATVFCFFYIALVTEIALRVAASKPIKYGQILLSSLIYMVPLYLISLVCTLSSMIGFLLFVIPGIFLTTSLYLASTAYVCENSGIIKALERSFELTKGHRLNIFGIWLTLRVIAIIISDDLFFSDIKTINSLIVPFEGAEVHLGTLSFFPSRIENNISIFSKFENEYVNHIIHSIIITVSFVLPVSIYQLLRLNNDQKTTPNVADVFD